MSEMISEDMVFESMMNRANNSGCCEGVFVVYVLRCVGGKWYVGMTFDLKSRLYMHAYGRGSVWTSKYRVVGLVGLYECSSVDIAKDMEKTMTLMYMGLYGRDSVRGGPYTSSVRTYDGSYLGLGKIGGIDD